MPKISLNSAALNLVKMFCREAETYCVSVEKTDSGATIIDAGIESEGGFLAGEMITEICLGGYGKAKILPVQYGDVVLPSVYVQTDHPALSTLASQFAGWQIKVSGFSAIGSGPARALALKPKKLYEKLGYKDESDTAVLVLETDKKPPEEAIHQIAESCGVSTDNLFLIAFSTASLAGSTQVSGRIVETGLHKLEKLGLDPLVAKHAWGYAPIIPLHPRSGEAMGRTNDAILYGGTANYIVSYDDDEELEKIVKQAPSTSSKMMQEARELAQKNPRFLEIFKEAGFDFYKIDPNIFAPAIVSINNLKTGKTFRAGSLDIPVMKESLGL
ncbi:MAG: methenyltetrahydromethanopterin cyclohydrolase [Candidatus Bathyarchaeota archaeon]|nr:methenyltetrahydromethanopterin cyclohydrolase [Candidatus Bathyarchaeota archaeon]